MVCRYENIKIARTTKIANVIGMTSEKATAPTAGTATLTISSVAYAEDERLSLANTASAVGLPRRSCWSWAVGSAGPSSRRFHRCTGPRGSGLLGCAAVRADGSAGWGWGGWIFWVATSL